MFYIYTEHIAYFLSRPQSRFESFHIWLIPFASEGSESLSINLSVLRLISRAHLDFSRNIKHPKQPGTSCHCASPFRTTLSLVKYIHCPSVHLQEPSSLHHTSQFFGRLSQPLDSWAILGDAEEAACCCCWRILVPSSFRRPSTTAPRAMIRFRQPGLRTVVWRWINNDQNVSHNSS